MSLSRRLITSSFGTLLCAALAAVGLPQAADGQPAVFRTPQFVVTAVKFKALDETGWDWMGSDEVLAVFSDLDPTHYDLVTSIYGDVDAGESRDFRENERCIAPHPRCEKGIPSVHFKLALWENDDTGFAHGELLGTHNNLEHGSYWGDDLIGFAEVTKSSAELVSELPAVGNAKDYVVTPTGGAGRYEVTYRITRLPNTIRIPPIGPPLELTISLQATVISAMGGGRVTLTWSGATTSTVDIYRNGVKLGTTANDGSQVDQVVTGTYVYRVCNVASTLCSANVTVVIP